MRRPVKAKLLIATGTVVFMAGIFGVIYPYIPAKAPPQDAMLMQSVQEVFEKELALEKSQSTPVPAKPVDVSYSQIQNRIKIPSANIDMPLLEGDEERSLAKGAWLWPTSPMPNPNSGNTVIFGHRFRYKPPVSNTMFSLDKVKKGDEVIVTWQGKTYRYDAQEQKIIEPTDLSVLLQTDKPTITLVTCTPIFSTDQRLILTAVFKKIQ